ncbi:IMP dehydrogenase [Halopenitus malekzadehii]|uniref:IMP dehydrogenase n=1 Tax=Halopenitus malekzadehii TaxID=1267564 RepID=A0A1H6JZ97_9EURY|nr:IMP dehydrogenase [Halopenitus malekzadehii]
MMEEIELPEERREEVLNTLDADELEVSEIMTPADEIVALSTTKSVDENIEQIRNTPHTRFPLVGDALTDFVGIVYSPSIITHFEDLHDGTKTLADIAAPAMTVASDTNVSDAFDQFQTEAQEVALVVQDGEIVGLLTATDALEAVMGQLEGPLDTGTL